MSNTAKAISTGVVATGAYHFIGSNDWKTSATYGAVTGASVLFTDTVVGWLPSLPGMFSFLGAYAMDAVSSLISAVAISLMDMYFYGNGLEVSFEVIKDLLRNFLYSLGSTIGGSYLTPFVSSITGM